MKRMVAVLACVLSLFIFSASSCFGLSVIVSKGVGPYAYESNAWYHMTYELKTATENKILVVQNLDDLTLMLNYDALWIDMRSNSPALSGVELFNIKEYIATGRRVVMMGDNIAAANVWNSQILSVVGTNNGSYVTGVAVSIIDHELTENVNQVRITGAGSPLASGTPLFDKNFATLWGDNVLTILDLNVLSDDNWNSEHNEQFARNIANWIASSTVPEPCTIDVHPDTLNKKSKGKYITCYIELPEDYYVKDIDIDTVWLSVNGSPISAESTPTEIGDYNDNGIPDFMVKFDRQLVQEVCGTGAVEMTLTCQTYDETNFEGSDTVLAIDKGQEHYSEDHGSVIY